MKLRWLVKRVPETKHMGNTSVGFKNYTSYREERVLQEWREGLYGVDGRWLDVPTVTEEES